MSAQQPEPDPELRSAILHRELERRLRLLEETDDAAFGEFGLLDWLVCTILFFLLPLLILVVGAT